MGDDHADGVEAREDGAAVGRDRGADRRSVTGGGDHEVGTCRPTQAALWEAGAAAGAWALAAGTVEGTTGSVPARAPGAPNVRAAPSVAASTSVRLERLDMWGINASSGDGPAVLRAAAGPYETSGGCKMSDGSCCTEVPFRAGTL